MPRSFTRPATRTQWQTLYLASTRLRCQRRSTRPKSARGTAEGRTTNTSLRGKAKLKLHDVVINGLSLVCVEQRDGLKPYLPESLRRQAFDTAHTLSHPSGRATVKRVALLYFWPSMSKDIVRWAKQCVPCQQSKVHRHNRAELGNFVTPGRPIRSCAHRHRQDASSPRISKLPHDDRPLHTLATGHPDRRHASSSAYELPSKRTCKRRPAEMVFGTSLRIPGEFVARQEPDKTSPSEFVSALRRLFQAIRPVPASRHVQHRPFVFKDLATSDYVFRRLDTILKPLEQPYTGPHRVIRRINERNFVVDVNGVAKTLSTDQLKPAYLDVADSGASQAHRSSQLPRSLHQHGESPFHSLRKLPSPLGGE
ncbi:unnamed protein product [Trichogramma brassicae]|uniref:Integrase zinc-binding domain-containing protein n=1 Tax=Trichogramma brassicae TaxID=86971 RepID=A0A6H5IDW6_9HYME|nr:unnamed protein product [Trichogramma brassicae]